MLHNGGQICGRRGLFDKGARVRGMGKDRPITEERGVGHKDDVCLGLAEIGDIRDRQGRAFAKNEVQNNRIKGLFLKDIHRRRSSRCQNHRGAKPLKMAPPKVAKWTIGLNDQYVHGSPRLVKNV